VPLGLVTVSSASPLLLGRNHQVLACSCQAAGTAVRLQVYDPSTGPDDGVFLAFNADHDHQVNEKLRFVQLTPPGSACSVVMGAGITEMEPGSQRGVQIVVSDVAAARQSLVEHGVQASEIDVQPWGSFVTFADPDGSTWALQELRQRS